MQSQLVACWPELHFEHDDVDAADVRAVADQPAFELTAAAVALLADVCFPIRPDGDVLLLQHAEVAFEFEPEHAVQQAVELLFFLELGVDLAQLVDFFERFFRRHGAFDLFHQFLAELADVGAERQELFGNVAEQTILLRVDRFEVGQVGAFGGVEGGKDTRDFHGNSPKVSLLGFC